MGTVPNRRDDESSKKDRPKHVLWGTDAWVDLWSGFRFPLQESETLQAKVQEVFSEKQRLDFPTITEICELAEKHPYEIGESVRILGQALREGVLSKIKAVTLLNEMLYDPRTVWCVAQDRNLLAMVRKLQTFRGDTGTENRILK